MEKKPRIETLNRISLPLPSTADLRGRQSVRTTFRLSPKSIEALSIVSVHLGIKQKSLFDHLLGDFDALNAIAREVQSESPLPRKRVQKTFVISRKTLAALEKISKSFQTPRDGLVEYSIKRLLPLISKERETHKKRKRVLEEMRYFVRQGDAILKDAKRTLGADDPVYEYYHSALNGLFSAYDQIEAFVEKGKIIEDF
jgi:hypothetical protein